MRRIPLLEKGGIITGCFSDYCTVRLRIPAGVVTPDQLAGVCEIAKRYGADTLHLTTRQTIEIPHIDPDQVPELVADLEQNNTPLGAERAEVVNITACPGTDRCKLAQIETIKLARAIDEKHFGKEMPCKIRIAIAGCPNSCVSSSLNEIGIVGVVTPIREPGTCTGCGTCVQYCHENAISIKNGTIRLNTDLCSHCGMCIFSCPFHIIQAEDPGYYITVGGRRGRHPKFGRDLVVLRGAENVLTVVDDIINWIYRQAWSGKLLTYQMDEIGFDELREKIIASLPEDCIIEWKKR
ncbi:MAG: 4Fe-4S binding protein [Methanomicrobiales archaeon]|jgi:dissimilatory sulfite reductase (desulfoviridin) alpha/beta subunit|nr:4Fe-4S binding protein [Methanomicrobiales archaeon]